MRTEGFFCNLDFLYGGLGKSKLWFFLSAVTFFQFWSSKPWIRIGIQPKMLDLDEYRSETLLRTTSYYVFLIKSRHNFKGMFDTQELNSERLKNTDNLKIHEVVARATPTKNTEIKVSGVNPE